jgi:hypothetical protein
MIPHLTELSSKLFHFPLAFKFQLFSIFFDPPLPCPAGVAQRVGGSTLDARPVCYCHKKAQNLREDSRNAYPNKLSKSLCDPTQNQWISSPFLRPTARYFAEILTDQISFVPDNFLKRRPV